MDRRSRSARARTIALVPLLVAGLTGTALLAPAVAAPPGPAAPAAVATSSPTTVTLVTGDQVSLTSYADGRSSVTVDARDGLRAAPGFHKHEADGRVYVVPADVAALVPSRLDWSLFDVQALADAVAADGSDGTPKVEAVGGTGTDLRGTDLRGGELGDALAAMAVDVAAPDVLGGATLTLAGVEAGTTGPGTQTSAPEGVEMVTLTVEGVARDGRPAGGISMVDVINVENRSIFEVIGAPFVGGTATFQVPAGTYAVLGYVFTYDEPSVYAYEGVATFEPEVEVSGATTVRLDARDSSKIKTKTPRPGEHTTTTLSYWRQDAVGGSYSHSYTLSHPIDTVYANPTDAVTTGEFEFYTHKSLVAPGITVQVAEPEQRTVDTAYVFSSARLDGRFDLEIVDVGFGRVQDYEGVDAEGKIALIRRGEGTFLEKMHNAEAAGATLAMIYNNVPGLLMVGGDPSTIPTTAMTQDEGEALAALVAEGGVEMRVKATRTSDYLYDAVLPEPDRIPADLTYVLDETTTADVRVRYHGQVAEHPVGEVRHKWRPWELASFGSLRQTTAPLTRDELVSAGDTMYAQYHWAYSTPALPFEAQTFALPRWYSAGDETRDSWLAVPATRPVLPGAAVPTDSAAYRSGDTVVLEVPEWGDREGHWAPAALAYDTPTFRLLQDGEVIASGTQPVGSFAVAPGASELGLEIDVERDAPWWRYPASVSTGWTVLSGTAAQADELALIDLVVRPKIDAAVQARSGKERVVVIRTGHQPGSPAGAVTALGVRVSYDEGGTWANADRVRDRGDGSYRVRLPSAPSGAASVSLSVSAEDDLGGSVVQRLVPAYGLTAGGWSSVG